MLANSKRSDRRLKFHFFRFMIECSFELNEEELSVTTLIEDSLQ